MSMSMSKGPLVRPFCLYLFGLGIIPCHMFHKSVFMIKRTMSSFMILVSIETSVQELPLRSVGPYVPDIMSGSLRNALRSE